MSATGYTGGDPGKVDVAGDTMTGPLILSGAPVSNLQAATKKYVDDNAGGGGPGGAVDSVNGQTGDVVLGYADVGADAAGTAASAVSTHEADTTNVHGIANTANLVLTNDSRLTDGRTPTAHASSHADGGTDEVSLDGSQITTGTVGIARIPTGQTGTTVPLGNDARFTDARTPTAHATSHQPGGTDAMTVDASAATGSLRTLGTGSTQAAAGNHNHAGTYQPLDSDLTTIAGLTPTTDNFMVAASSAWASRTPAQAKTALGLVKGDVGLGNVDNTSNATERAATATLTNKTLTSPVINNPTGAGVVSTYLDNAGSYGVVTSGDIYIGTTTPPSPTNGDIWLDTTP